jgi:hypothetical protein
MADPAVRVLAEDLFICGAAVDGHAMDMQETHTLTESRIDSALPYLPSLAATALAAKAAEWQATTAALTGRLMDHAMAFHTSAMTYVESDESNAEMLRQVGASGSSLRFQ